MKLASLLLGFVVASALNAGAQTTTWTAATNPHVVNGTYTVAANQTLVLEAGVIVQIKAASTLQINGRLVSNGTAASHVTITGATNYNSALDITGSSTLQFTDVKAKTVPDTNSTLVFSDCTFSGNGSVFNGQVVQSEGTHAPYLQFDRCKFQGDGTNASASLYVSYCTVVLHDTQFLNGSYANVYPAYLYLNNVTSDKSSNAGLTLGSDSDLYLNNISVTNALHGGLQLAGDTRNGTNVLIGANVTLTGNEYPVHLTIAGLYPTSNIPATGNSKNLIHVSDCAGAGGFWPKFAIPYYNDASPLSVDHKLNIFPGVTVKMALASYFIDYGRADGIRAFGTKQQPIIFERADPAQSWYSLHSDRTDGGRLRHTIVRGNTAGVNGGMWRLENCVFQNNDIGTSGNALVSGSQYLANGIGHDAGADSNFNSPQNPNSFEGNGTGMNYSPDARNCWWNSPSGPRISTNPGGTGDPIGYEQTQYKPFLTARPDYSDAPPELVLMRPAFQQDPGSKVTLRWKSTDDVGIVSHKILFSAVGNWPGSFQTVATLPGDQQTYEWTVPAIGFQVAGNNAFIKVVATDTTGKESFDEAEIVIPTNDIGGDVQWSFSAGQTFEAGEILANVFTPVNVDRYMTRVEYYIEDVRGELRKMFSRGIDLGGMPFMSSDTLRYVVSYGDTTNHRKYWYSPFFRVRPKSLLGDAPPTVHVMSPANGQTYSPGVVIPITWTASDDEGLRAFDIVASYDRGRTWNPIVRDLPGTARSYDWQTAPGTGYSDVRIMVQAKDARFQFSSDGMNNVFATNSTATEPQVSTLVLNPTTISTGETSTGTVTLATPAPAGGTLVTLSQNGQTFLNVPANITIPAGQTIGTFPITTTNVVVTGTFQITASSSGVTKAAYLDVTWQIENLALPPKIPGGATVSGAVTLSAPAPQGGAVVNLSSTDPATAGVPASITVPEGEQSANFTASTGSISQQKSITISGEHAGTTKQIAIVVTPATNQITAVSRKVHGSAGALDIPLPLSGSPGVECRSGGATGNYQVVVTFPQTVSVASASVSSGAGSVNDANANGPIVTVNLTGLTNAQNTGVTLSGVNNGNTTADYYVPISILIADVNGDGFVNSADALIARNRSGQSTDSANFRADVNVDGSINAADATVVRNRSGSGLTTNTTELRAQ